MRMIVRRSAERTIVPRDGPVDRVRAAWIVCVDVGEEIGASGLIEWEISCAWGSYKEHGVLCEIPSADDTGACHSQDTSRDTPCPQPDSHRCSDCPMCPTVEVPF